MKIVCLLGAAALFAASSAQAITFDVTASPPFVDIETGAMETSGEISGFFEVVDQGADGVIDAVDIVAWSFTGSGFNSLALNVTLSSNAADAGVLVISGNGTADIGAGLSAGVLDFFQDNQFLGIQIDFRIGSDLDFFNFNLDPSFAVFTTSSFTVTPPAQIPLPAPFLLLPLGLLGLAVVARKPRTRRLS